MTTKIYTGECPKCGHEQTREWRGEPWRGSDGETSFAADCHECGPGNELTMFPEPEGDGEIIEVFSTDPSVNGTTMVVSRSLQIVETDADTDARRTRTFRGETRDQTVHAFRWSGLGHASYASWLLEGIRVFPGWNGVVLCAPETYDAVEVSFRFEFEEEDFEVQPREWVCHSEVEGCFILDEAAFNARFGDQPERRAA